MAWGGVGPDALVGSVPRGLPIPCPLTEVGLGVGMAPPAGTAAKTHSPPPTVGCSPPETLAPPGQGDDPEAVQAFLGLQQRHFL